MPPAGRFARPPRRIALSDSRSGGGSLPDPSGASTRRRHAAMPAARGAWRRCARQVGHGQTVETIPQARRAATRAQRLRHPRAADPGMRHAAGACAGRFAPASCRYVGSGFDSAMHFYPARAQAERAAGAIRAARFSFVRSYSLWAARSIASVSHRPRRIASSNIPSVRGTNSGSRYLEENSPRIDRTTSRVSGPK